MENLVKLFENPVKSSWNSPPLSFFQVSDANHSDMAEHIWKLQAIWEHVGLPKGTIKRFMYV